MKRFQQIPVRVSNFEQLKSTLTQDDKDSFACPEKGKCRYYRSFDSIGVIQKPDTFVLLFRLEYKSWDSYSRLIEFLPKFFHSNLVFE